MNHWVNIGHPMQRTKRGRGGGGGGGGKGS